MHVAEPEKLSDKEWAERVRELEYIRKQENKEFGQNSGYPPVVTR